MQSRVTETAWHRVLIDGHGSLVKARHVFRRLPSAPRCKLCNNPFGGPVGRLLAGVGFSPSRKNPNLCSRCCDALPVGGAEVDIAVVFADVRGSVALGQRGVAADFAASLNRFYVAATRTLLRHDAVIDKLIGDQVMAFFVQGIAGADYRRRAVQAGIELLEAVGYGSDAGPWVDVGMAVNAGVAYVGNVGGAVVDFTALGDPVNVAARMQQKAAGGELLVAAGVADDMIGEAPMRSLELRGCRQQVNAFVVGAPARSTSRQESADGHSVSGARAGVTDPRRVAGGTVGGDRPGPGTAGRAHASFSSHRHQDRRPAGLGAKRP